MKHNITEVGTCRKKLSVDFESQEVDQAVKESYDDLSKYVQVKGFRKGHVPRKFLEKRYANDVYQDVAVKLAQKHIPEIIKAEKIPVMGEMTEIDKNAKAEPGKPLNISIEFDVRPAFDVPEYKGIELTSEQSEVTEADIDEKLEQYKKLFADFEPTEDSALKGDLVEVDVKAVAGDKEIFNLEKQKIRVEGNQLFGLECPDLEVKLIGSKKDSDLTFSLIMPQEHPDEELKGKTAEVKVKVLQVLRPKLPQLDDDFAVKVGLKNLAELKERIKVGLEAQSAQKTRSDLENKVLDKLIEATSFDVPGNFLNDEVNALVEQNKMQLLEQRVPYAEIEAEINKMKPEIEKLAEKRVRWSIISDAIADKEELEITPEEVQRHITNLANAYKTTPAKMLKRIQSHNGMSAVVAEIRDIKIMQLILDNAKVNIVDNDNAQKKEND